MTTTRYETIIGIEVHAQLRTESKMFCACPTAAQPGDPDEPNTRVCPVCLGMPGTLPVVNRRAVELVIRTGIALDCHIETEAVRFERKNYFYPDLPKGYQISQYEIPVVQGGHVDFSVGGLPRRVRLTRAQLEEDAGKSLHEAYAGATGIDLNRAGTPLLEIVTEPDIASAGEAERYLEALREIVAYVGTSDGNMEQGNLRCEPNVNLVFANGDRTAIVEIKNLNSVKNVAAAIRHETARQEDEYRRHGATSKTTPRSPAGPLCRRYLQWSS